MPNQDIIVIGASAGGIEALNSLVKGLPNSLPAAVFVVIHFPAHITSYLPNILTRSGPLPATHAVDGEKIQKGRIYIAPPNQHLEIKDGRVHLNFGPREHGFRPAIDLLFRSAAATYGERVMGIILSGMLADGSLGLLEIHNAGGVTVVQDPREAVFQSMPEHAIATVPVDHILPVKGIAALAASLSGSQTDPQTIRVEEDISMKSDQENQLVQNDIHQYENGNSPKANTVLTCPDCGGVVWEFGESNLLRFRCHVGHIFSSESMVQQQTDVLETALWSAVRLLEERATLMRRLGKASQEKGITKGSDRFHQRAAAAEQSAEVIRNFLMDGTTLENDSQADVNQPFNYPGREESGQIQSS